MCSDEAAVVHVPAFEAKELSRPTLECHSVDSVTHGGVEFVNPKRRGIVDQLSSRIADGFHSTRPVRKGKALCPAGQRNSSKAQVSKINPQESLPLNAWRAEQEASRIPPELSEFISICTREGDVPAVV
jgi:hypothetical protein